MAHYQSCQRLVLSKEEEENEFIRHRYNKSHICLQRHQAKNTGGYGVVETPDGQALDREKGPPH